MGAHVGQFPSTQDHAKQIGGYWPTPKEQMLFLCILSGQGQLRAFGD
jgi:hypothetical protein